METYRHLKGKCLLFSVRPDIKAGRFSLTTESESESESES